MTSAPSQSSGQPADRKAATQARARRLQILAALDIDVWAQRSGASALDVEVSTDSVQPAAAGSSAGASVRKLPAGAGPAEALALLEASPRSGSAREVPSASASAAASTSASAPAAGLAQPLDLLCLAGKHGLLLTRHEGLGPQAQRLLQDILQSATRAIGARLDATITAEEPAPPARIKLKSLRFTWPPETPDGGHNANVADLGNSETDGDTARALRGFLNRQLKGVREPVVLYVEDPLAPQLVMLLDTIELPVDSERRVALGSPEALMSDSSAKRALWRTLSTL